MDSFIMEIPEPNTGKDARRTLNILPCSMRQQNDFKDLEKNLLEGIKKSFGLPCFLLSRRPPDALIPIETRPDGTVLCAVEGAAYETRVVIPAPRNRHDFTQYT